MADLSTNLAYSYSSIIQNSASVEGGAGSNFSSSYKDAPTSNMNELPVSPLRVSENSALIVGNGLTIASPSILKNKKLNSNMKSPVRIVFPAAVNTPVHGDVTGTSNPTSDFVQADRSPLESLLDFAGVCERRY